MADIEVVIKIPEEIRLALINNVQLSLDQQSMCDSCVKQAIVNGTPLPKGHGRLIDADMVCDELEGKSFSTSSDYHNAIDAVDDVPTIIEPYKAESEG